MCEMGRARTGPGNKMGESFVKTNALFRVRF